MTMRRTHNVTLTVGEYEKDGQQKKQRVNIGTMMTDDQNGNMSICLKVPPSFKTSEKTGYPEAWLSIFPIDENRQQQAPQAGFGTQQHAQNVAPQQFAQPATPPQPVQQPQHAPQVQQPQQQPNLGQTPNGGDIPF